VIPLTIRLMTIADYDNIYTLWTGTPGVGLNDVDDSREGIARYLARNPSSCFVAEKEGRIVGTILSGHDGRRAFIYHAAVALNEREQGVGSQLVDCVIAALKREGIQKVVLVAFRHNLIANMFWEKRGFRERTDLCFRSREIG
jgi:N-acetylglutamate synthase